MVATMGLVTLRVSGLIVWWKRRPEGVLGAPAMIRRVRFSSGLIVCILALGLYFPFLGGSMILVGLIERFILRRIAPTQRWLGLNPVGVPKPQLPPFDIRQPMNVITSSAD